MRNACAVRDDRRQKRSSSMRRAFYALASARHERQGACTHGSTAITASRHHLYLRDTAKPCPGRIVTAQGPYSRRLGLIGPPRYLSRSLFPSLPSGPDESAGPALNADRTKERCWDWDPVSISIDRI